MKRPCFRRARWLICALLLLPLIGWILLLVIVPTGWARNRIAAAISESTGRPVRLEGLHVGAFGRVRLTGLAVESPSGKGDPWLQVADAATDLHLVQLLTGCMKPTEIEVDGLALRILRRKDGTLELSDLLRRPRPNRQNSDADADTGPTVIVRLNNARLHVVDEPSGTKLEINRVEGSITWTRSQVRVNELHGTLNGGTFELAAQLERGEHAPTFEGQLRAEGVAMAGEMNAIAYLVPVLSRTAGAVDGTMGLNVYLSGQGLSAREVTRTLVGKGTVTLDPLELDGSKLISDISKIIEIPTHHRVGSVKSDFVVKNGRISTNDLTLLIGRNPVVLSGWTGFDGQLDYRIKTDQLVDKLPSQARDFLAELQIDVGELAVVRVHGTLDDVVVSLDGRLDTGRPTGGAEPNAPRVVDKQKLRDLSRQLKDRFLR